MIVVGALAMPLPDPLGYAAPVWVLQGLSYFTLSLHLLAMNFTIGACLLLIWTHFRNRAGHAGVKHFFGSSLPLGMSYVITLGVPPLLFVQVLYGQLFYSSSVLIGALWILVIPAVLIAYAAFYYHKLQREARPRYQWAVVAVATTLLLCVGYIYVNNLTLSMSPDKWLRIYEAHPGGGILHHGEPTVPSRYLLFLSGAFAAAGVALLWRGAFLFRWGYDTEANQSQKLGFRAFLLSPMLWIIAASWVYSSRPEDIKAMFVFDSTTVLLAVGVVSALVAIAFAYLSVGRRNLLFPLLSSLGIFGGMVCTVVFRDQVRLEYIKPYLDIASIPVNAQWGMLALFLMALVVALALLVVLMVKVLPKIAEGARERLEKTIAAGRT
jgi:hypothetical protein